MFKTKEVFTAVYNGQVVGSVRIEVRKDNTAYLSRFGVHSDFQNTINLPIALV